MYWLYWESPDNQIPKIVTRLIKIFQKTKKFNLVNDKTIKNYISIVDTSKVRFIAQKVDYYRAKLLYTYGGIWLDIDTIILDDIEYIYQGLLSSNKEVCISASANNVCLQYLIAKPQSRIFKYWYLKMEEYIIMNKFIAYDFFGKLMAQIILKNNLQDTIIPFPNEIVFRFGCKILINITVKINYLYIKL